MQLEFPTTKEEIDRFIDSLRDKCIESNNLAALEKFNDIMDKKMREFKLRDINKSFTNEWAKCSW